ncbi:endonuclease/exonuclease/phosphatase family protein [Enterobacter cloacae complex sp. GF14B]|uniref:endonuclease/exonuclease/phosphatase family protein n=1 Tax=Enterobacter cloacae complex sp. GF14B TaxID=2511982 RepID=UPI00100F9FB7|nr:endonuclease/exonuclease/phosphatase family protein [Enterobacter cloacae complex sp. GF14B]RYA45856.1 hypothetical protein DD606_24775 [Enterobacter cloacae complex sp. GF14B]
MTYETELQLKICFWNCNGYPWNAGVGIDELTSKADVVLLVETWEHDTQRINGLEDYNVHSLMWSKNLKQRRGQGGVACMVKKGLEDFVSIVKDDKYKRYVWLKIMTPKRTPICFIPHHDLPFYACMDRDQPFSDLEEDIAYFKGEGDVIVFGDMNARTKTLQHDTQQFDMPYISRELEEVHLYDCTSMDEKEPDHYGKLLLHMCNSTGMLIANGVSLWSGTNGFTCRKHNGDSVIDYMLLSKAIMYRIKSFMFGQWTSKSDNWTLCIDLACGEATKHDNLTQREEKLSLCMDFKRAPMYIEMVEQKLWMTKLQYDAPLETKWEAFKKVICSCAKECFAIKHLHGINKDRSCKRWFDKECQDARKSLIKLDATMDKDNYQSHCIHTRH